MTRRVNPKEYTREYYLTSCAGYEGFKKSAGKILEPHFKKIVTEIPIRKGMRVLDIGCGRGELTFWAARKRAKVVGIDYSGNAIQLALETLEKQSKKVKDNVTFKVMDAKRLKFPKESFDAVFLVEVLEHLYPEEQDKVFKEILRVLKNDGFVFVHTAPSRWFNDYTYRFWCYPVSTLIVSAWNFFTNKKYPNLAPREKLRPKYHKIMHVNEPTYFSLKKLFKKHNLYGAIRSTNVTVLKPKISWKDKLFNTLVYLYPLSKFPPFNIFWGNDFYAVLRTKQ